jgi:hypothetical protein
VISDEVASCSICQLLDLTLDKENTEDPQCNCMRIDSMSE